jgi:thioredoxin-like negative regulator of GroEL
LPYVILKEPEKLIGSWDKLTTFLASLPDEDRTRFSSHAAVGLPADTEGIAAVLSAYATENPSATPSALLATTGARAGTSGDLDLARTLGHAALDLAEEPEDLQLAHVSLAQTHFQNRRDEADLKAFVEHCWAAIEAGHAGSFCYERLAALYEYWGEKKEAAKICRRAIEVLEAAGDPRSATRFRKRFDRLSRE